MLALIALAGCGGSSVGAERATQGEPPAKSPDSAQPTTGPVSARLLADVSHVAPGQEFTLAIELEIEDGWYVHWKHPGDGGKPTRVAIEAPDGFFPGAPRFPGPTRFDTEAGESRFGYRQRALVSIPVIAPDAVRSAKVELVAEAEWMACRAGRCQTGRAAPRITLPVATAKTPSQPAHAGRFAAHRQRLPGELADVEGVTTSWQGVGDEQAELLIEIAGATDLMFFPDGDIGLVGQAVTPAPGGKALRLWLDAAGGGRAAGVIRMSRGEAILYLRLALEIPADPDLD